MADTTASTIWIDANGKTRQTILRGVASLATVNADLLSLSNADVQRGWEGPTVVNPTPSPTNAVYPNVADYAVLVFQTAGGDEQYITLPAPQSGIFMADQETVDPVAIATLITDVIGTVSPDGVNTITAYVGGFRRRSVREYQ